MGKKEESRMEPSHTYFYHTTRSKATIGRWDRPAQRKNEHSWRGHSSAPPCRCNSNSSTTCLSPCFRILFLLCHLLFTPSPLGTTTTPRHNKTR
jgi:hypothetical protein